MLTADVQWFTGLPLGGATIDLLSSADSYAWWTLFGTSTAWHFVSSWKRTLVSCVTVEHTPPLFCFLGDWVPPHDHINRMGNVHTCITWSHEQKWDCTPWFMEYQNIFWVCWAFVRVDFYPWGFCPMVFFVHWAFSLSHHLIIWTEFELCTPVPRDLMNRNWIVQFNCWSIKLFSVLGLLSALIFILWGSCPMMLSLSAYLITWIECWLS